MTITEFDKTRFTTLKECAQGVQIAQKFSDIVKVNGLNSLSLSYIECMGWDKNNLTIEQCEEADNYVKGMVDRGVINWLFLTPEKQKYFTSIEEA